MGYHIIVVTYFSYLQTEKKNTKKEKNSGRFLTISDTARYSEHEWMKNTEKLSQQSALEIEAFLQQCTIHLVNICR